jgi:hypothetical protein
VLPIQEDVKGGGLYATYNSSVDVVDSIFWGNTSDVAGNEIAISGTDPINPLPATVKVAYSDVEGGSSEVYVDVGHNLIWDVGNINEDPLFEEGPFGQFYLSQIPAGQSADSPCVDTGSTDSRTAGLDRYITRTDHITDTGIVDMGYHSQFKIVPDICRIAEMERDGIIDLPDMVILAEYWLSLGCSEDDGSEFGWCHAADIDKNQSVDLFDYIYLSYCWQIEDTEPPSPNPMEWEIEPHSVASGTIEMTAKTALDAWWRNDDENIYIQYYFECSEPGCESGWIDEPFYVATGLVDGQQYSFRVQARDGRRREGPEDENRTAFSGWALATAGAESDPPIPNPSRWATLEHDGVDGLPATSGPTSVKMVAYASTDPSEPVEYYFRYTELDGVTPGLGDGHDSGWQISPIYEDTDLTVDQWYTYVVRARDAWGNETAESLPGSVLVGEWDNIPPTPDPPQWQTFPVRVIDNQGSWWHTMAVEPADDDSGVEYFFECVDNGSNSGWQSMDGVDPFGNPTTPNVYWVNVGSQFLYYTYRVKVRDMSINQNETGWSTSEMVQ